MTDVKQRETGSERYLSDQSFVLLHQLVQILLVFLQSLQQVHLLVLKHRQLFIHLETGGGGEEEEEEEEERSLSTLHFLFSSIGKHHGKPLEYSFYICGDDG